VAEPRQTVTFQIPANLSSRQRQKLSRRLIAFIQTRTKQGLDINNSSFKSYSTEYADSLEFKIAGKSKSRPNLQLTGEMLRELDEINSGEGFITLGYDKGSEQNDKAAWTAASDNGVSREFLGVNSKDLSNMVSTIQAEEAEFVRVEGDDVVQARKQRERVEQETARVAKRFITQAGLPAAPLSQNRERESGVARRAREASSLILRLFGGN